MTLTFAEPIGVLLVEDNPIDAKVAQHVISSAGFAANIRRAKDGQEALDILHGDQAELFRPDVILLDLSLPRLRGIDVIHLLAKDPELAAIPIVVLTGSEDRDDVLLEARQQVHRYLRKPFDVAELTAIMRQVENRARLNRLRALAGNQTLTPPSRDKVGGDSVFPAPGTLERGSLG